MMLAMAPLDAMMNDMMLGVRTPSCDKPRLEVTDETLSLSLAAPGIAPSDMNVRFADGVLKIHGKTNSRATHFETHIPTDADIDSAVCTCVDGILTVSIPRKPAAEPTVVPVSAEEETETDGEEKDAATPYKLTITTPGFSPSDFVIVADYAYLKVVGESKRTKRRLQKNFRLPSDADGAFASATAVDGLLTVTIPKRPAAEAKTLTVNRVGAVEVKPEAEEDTTVVVTKEAPPPEVDAPAVETAVPTRESVRAHLASMGFADAPFVEAVIDKNGADVEACTRDLVAATGWDEHLDDLAEMGFEDRELNKALLLAHDGNLKRTVKELASAYAKSA